MPKNVRISAQVKDKEGNSIYNDLTTKLFDSNGNLISEIPFSGKFSGNVGYSIKNNIPDTTYTLTIIPDNTGKIREFQFKKNTSLPLSINKKQLNFGTITLEQENPIPKISVNITGKIIDDSTNEELIQANIKISKNGENFGGFVTNTNGNFGGVKDLEVGTYTFEISYVGYNSKSFTKQITPTTKEINFSTIKLIDNKVLQEIQVVAESFTGTIVDKTTKQPISGATILSDTDEKDKAISQTDGTFNLAIQLDETVLLPSGETQTERKYKQITAIASADEYSQSDSIQLIKGDGQLKKDLGIIKLSPLEEEIQDQIIENKTLTEPQKKIAGEEISKDFISSTLKKMFRTIQDRLIPIILRQIAAFGVSKFNEEVLKNIDKIPKTCPPNIESLNKLIDKKNKLTKQLNNLYKSINSINKYLEIPPRIIGTTEKTLFAAKGTVQSLAFIPSSVATPNPVGPVLVAKDLIEKSEDLISILKDKIGVGTLQLRIIIEELRKVILLLDILDALIQTCAEGISDDDNVQTQTAVSQQLLNSTQQQSQQLSPVVTNVNGFDMSVITEDGETEFDLKRRRAVAKNKAGIIMLKGELSFSSNDQILIDELVFYIQQNDLKAE